jgi:hypothetical protein
LKRSAGIPHGRTPRRRDRDLLPRPESRREGRPTSLRSSRNSRLRLRGGRSPRRVGAGTRAPRRRQASAGDAAEGPPPRAGASAVIAVVASSTAGRSGGRTRGGAAAPCRSGFPSLSRNSRLRPQCDRWPLVVGRDGGTAPSQERRPPPELVPTACDASSPWGTASYGLARRESSAARHRGGCARTAPRVAPRPCAGRP